MLIYWESWNTLLDSANAWKFSKVSRGRLLKFSTARAGQVRRPSDYRIKSSSHLEFESYTKFISTRFQSFLDNAGVASRRVAASRRLGHLLIGDERVLRLKDDCSCAPALFDLLETRTTLEPGDFRTSARLLRRWGETRRGNGGSRFAEWYNLTPRNRGRVFITFRNELHGNDPPNGKDKLWFVRSPDGR